MQKQSIAYHFTGDTLRDGSSIPAIGVWLVHKGPLVMCESGLHASIDAFDALRYAPGAFLHRVEMGGKIIKGDDKLVASKRKILAMIDATELLRSFARQCALDVIHLWDAPPVVIEYLKTGDEKLRTAARAAARDAAWSAACAAARAAAGDAAWSAARDAAWFVARDAQRQRFNQMVADAFAEVSNA